MEDPELPAEFRPRNLDTLEEAGGEAFATMTVAEPEKEVDGEEDVDLNDGVGEKRDEVGNGGEKGLGVNEPKSPTMSISSSSASFVQPGMAL